MTVVIPTEQERGKRILVIAPHADDETIGCGGTLALAAERGAVITLVVMAVGGIKHYHLEQAAMARARLDELEASARILGVARTKVLFAGHDMRLEDLPMLEIVTALDDVVRSAEFDECYIPESSHNRDHQITHDAAVAALRPAGRKPLKLIAEYEGTSRNVHSDTAPAGTLFVDIEATLSKKLAALREYKSQIRDYPHPISEEAVRRLAAMRGLECGIQVAERFRVLRMIR